MASSCPPPHLRPRDFFLSFPFLRNPPFRVTPRHLGGGDHLSAAVRYPPFPSIPNCFHFSSNFCRATHSFSFRAHRSHTLFPLILSAYVPIGPVTQGASRAPSFCTPTNTRHRSNPHKHDTIWLDGSAAKSGPYHPHSPSLRPCPYSPLEFPNGLRGVKAEAEKKKGSYNVSDRMEFVERIEYKME